LRANRDSLPGEHFASYHTHYRSVAGFVLSENIDTAMIGSLVAFPFVGLVFGCLGGLLGAARQGSQRRTVGGVWPEAQERAPY
jgi:hypothetical protein